MSLTPERPASMRSSKRKASDLSPGESSAAAGRSKACTACRQMKAGCDSAKTFPAPCSRCKARKLDCRMDSNFKRVPTRHKLEEVTSQLNSLQEALKSRSESQNPNVHGSEIRNSRTVSPDAVAALTKTPSIQVDASHVDDGLTDPSFYGTEDSVNSALAIGEQILGSTTITGLAVVHLFDHYRENYLHLGPVLDASISLAELCKHSRLLFWTIIITSSRYHHDYSFLHERFIAPYEQLLSMYLVRPILALSTIHALLILAYWPLPVAVQIQDPIWNYLGLATNAATQLGMHRPGHEREFGFPRAGQKDVILRVKTWLHIFQLNTIISTRIGVPSPLDRESYMRDISRFCDDYLPPGSALAIRCEVQTIFARSTAALQAREDEDSRLALILMFSGELDGFRSRFGRAWDLETELQFLGAKLFLLGWSFPYHNQSDATATVSSQSRISRGRILHEAMRISIKLIHTFCEPGKSDRPSQLVQGFDNTLPSQVHQPKFNFFTLYYALETLYIFLAHFSPPVPSDTDLAFNHIRIVHNTLSHCAGNNEKHEYARMAYNIDYLDKWHTSGRRLPPEAAIKSRMGASLFYDGMQKMAVLKAEKGGRSFTSDLTQPLPDREKHRGLKAGIAGDEVDREGPDPAGAAAVKAATVGSVGVQEGPVDQTGLWPGWDESIWGWDFNQLDTPQLDLDLTNGDMWQPPGESNLFG